MFAQHLAQLAKLLWRNPGVYRDAYSNEEVAEYLRFTDTTNFRRSFKRWTGLVPSAVRDLRPGRDSWLEQRATDG